MLVTADQLVLHALGDYIIQSDWMANSKTKNSVACLVHALSYTLPFLFLTSSWQALAVIAGTHFVIDRWRLARYVCWLKNFQGPVRWTSKKWVCDACGHTEDKEAEVGCWKCGKGDMIFRGHKGRNAPWSDCVATGYPSDRPLWMSAWLLIIADNVMHVLCNALALRYL